MGSCLSKPSSKGQKKKRKETSVEGEWDASVQKKKSWKASEDVRSISTQKKMSKTSEEEEQEVPSVSVDAAACSLPLPQANKQESLALPSLPADVAFSKSEKLKLPPASPPVQKLSPSPSLSPDPVTLPLSSQTPLKKKLSGELLTNPLKRPSSPCKSLLHNMPPSPGLKKSIYRNEEEECKFPSLARKQWLSQAHVAEMNSANKGPGAEDNLAEGNKASVGENLSKQKNLCNTETLSRKGGLASKEPGTDATGRMNKGHEPKAMANTSKFSVTEAVNLAGKTVSSRTNSLSRDMSPVELSRAKARPSSPLKRSPSITATDGSRLTRSASGKVASPNRSGLPAGERHDSAKGRSLHKQSLSKEFLTDPSADTSAHKRSSSRDSVSECSAEIIRKPSPPKKTPIIPSSISMSSMDASRLTSKRPSTPSKENAASHRLIIQEPSSMARGVRTAAQRSLSSAVHEPDILTASNNNKSTKRKEKSPLRRTCNGMATLHSSTKMGDRNTDYSINSDTTAANQFDLPGKDSAARTRKSGIRTPLKEISENSTKLTSSKQGAKEVNGPPVKARNELPVQKESVPHELHSTEEAKKGYAFLQKTDETTVLDLASNINDYVKDPLEVKAENLVMGGKSVLSAFKALEEYRLKYSNLNLEPRNKDAEDVWYSRQQPYTTEKENFSQPLQGLEIEKALPKDDLKQAEELPRSRSTKKSCEQFLFPDVQSLLMSENEGMQLEGGLTMPASISKACSILRAVADLNMGTPMYPKKKEAQDEIERPNLLSFQFGEGDSHRVTSG